MECKCNKKSPPATNHRIARCERGFLIDTGDRYEGLGKMYAFDHIEDAAAWLVGQYNGGDA